jgi:predicted phosphoribosyltransferase
MPKRFRDRADAGRQLAAALAQYAGREDVLVLALPRGGVPVGYQVAKALGAAFDVFIVRKLGVPGRRELAMGAIATGRVRVLNDDVVRDLGLDASVIDAVTAREAEELERRQVLYRGTRPPPRVAGRLVILVDDGLATGATMRAAAAAVRTQQPMRLVVAVPTAAPETCDEFRQEVDDVICLDTPPWFVAVGDRYDDFRDTTDEEVRKLLGQQPGAA